MSSMCFLFVFQNTVGDATDETEEDIDLCSVLKVFDCEKTLETDDSTSSDDELEKANICKKLTIISNTVLVIFLVIMMKWIFLN